MPSTAGKTLGVVVKIIIVLAYKNAFDRRQNLGGGGKNYYSISIVERYQPHLIALLWLSN